MIQNSNITIVRGDSESVIIPIADSDSPTDDFRNPFPTSDEVNYVIAETYDDNDVLYSAVVGEIDIGNWGDLKPDSPDLPDSYPTLADDQSVVRVQIPQEETAKFAPTEGADVDDLVHDCQITNSAGKEITVMQGDVTVLPSATVEVS